LENGKRQPSNETLGVLADVFQVAVPDLYNDRSAIESALLEVFRRIPASRHQELIRILELAAIPPEKGDS
jgi:transcriptional regulator with XRE-family HTH domain